MAHVHANIVKFYTKLEEYRGIEKYADVTIKCQEKLFKCHRVILAMASNFFDTMFSSQFKESTDRKIALPETNVETFEEVVQFIYTGDVSVTSSNFNRLLEASEFFGLPGMSDLCTKFIETHKIGVQNTLNAFVFACRTSKQALVDRLSKDIVEHFKIFSRADEFLEIPFEGLRTILDQWSSPKTEEVKISGIIRWVSHDQKGRIGHIYDLVEMIRFGNVTSDEYIQLVFKKLWTESTISTGSLTESLKPVGFNDITETSRETELEKNLLRVYIKSRRDVSMRVFSVDSGSNCTSTPAKNFSNDSPGRWIQSVPLDNYLYRLDYCHRGLNANKPSDHQAFNMYTSANMMGPSLSLMPPPLIFGDVRLCALRNNIYAYHRTMFRHQLMRASPNNPSPFDDEEINRGVYIYNCELDNWFPVPAMKKQLQASCMVGWNNQILYLIDGVDNLDRCVKYVQAYDCRMGMWQELPNSRTASNFSAGGACVHNDKIYVCGGGHANFEIFDPTACKWQTSKFEQKMNSPMLGHRMISYSNKLWAIGDFSREGLANHLSSIQICSFQTTEPRQGRQVIDMSWSSSNVLMDAAGDSTSGIIMDVIIF